MLSPQQTDVIASSTSTSSYPRRFGDDDVNTMAESTSSLSCSNLELSSSSGNDYSSVRSTVSFGTTEIREYERHLGGLHDLPLPLALGWKYEQLPAKSVGDFEERKKQYSRCSTAVSNTTITDRYTIFNQYGYSVNELKEAERARTNKETADSSHDKDKPGIRIRRMLNPRKKK